MVELFHTVISYSISLQISQHVELEYAAGNQLKKQFNEAICLFSVFSTKNFENTLNTLGKKVYSQTCWVRIKSLSKGDSNNYFDNLERLRLFCLTFSSSLSTEEIIHETDSVMFYSYFSCAKFILIITVCCV